MVWGLDTGSLAGVPSDTPSQICADGPTLTSALRQPMHPSGGRMSEQNGTRKPRFQLVPFGQLRPSKAPAYLINGLIPRVGLTVVWGSPKSGKSFVISDLMMSVALGWEFRERKVIQGAVVYCAFEGADGFGKRAAAFRQHY